MSPRIFLSAETDQVLSSKFCVTTVTVRSLPPRGLDQRVAVQVQRASIRVCRRAEGRDDCIISWHGQYFIQRAVYTGWRCDLRIPWLSLAYPQHGGWPCERGSVPRARI